MKFLERFAEYKEFRNYHYQNVLEDATNDEIKSQTQDELMDFAFQEIKRALASDILEKVRNVAPVFLKD
jgi:restriction system protein